MTPLCAEDKENEGFYQAIEVSQQQLIAELEQDLLIPVPPATFHLTVADLIWENNYLANVKDDPDYENKLRQEVEKSFEDYNSTVKSHKPIEFQFLGITIFPRALVICLAPKRELDYERITQMRQCIYQNRTLMSLGVQQQYPFTAHITLGYFGTITPKLNRDRFLTTLAKINEQWIDQEIPNLKIRRVQLRKFDNMISYYRENDWPEIVL
jgi:hypothetical protein